MKTNYTPGTWYAKEGQIYPEETGKTLATIPYFDNENQEQIANQQLIALAPEMAAFIAEMAERYSNSEWISGEAKKILTKAGIELGE